MGQTFQFFLYHYVLAWSIGGVFWMARIGAFLGRLDAFLIFSSLTIENRRFWEG
jgi:hypothetical protein